MIGAERAAEVIGETAGVLRTVCTAIADENAVHAGDRIVLADT
jgi:hypothetical protein